MWIAHSFRFVLSLNGQFAALHHQRRAFYWLYHLACAVGKHFVDEAVLAHEHTVAGGQRSPIGFSEGAPSHLWESPFHFINFFFAQHDSIMGNPVVQINLIFPVSNSCIMPCFSRKSSTTRCWVLRSFWPIVFMEIVEVDLRPLCGILLLPVDKIRLHAVCFGSYDQ